MNKNLRRVLIRFWGYAILAIPMLACHFLVNSPSSNQCSSIQGVTENILERERLSSSLNLSNLWNLSLYIPDGGIQVTDTSVILSDYQCDRVIAIDIESGELKWEHEIHNPTDLFLDNYRDQIYVFSLPQNGRAVTALNVESGQEIWNLLKRFERGTISIFPYSDGRVFMLSTVTGESEISSLDPNNGEIGNTVRTRSRTTPRSSWIDRIVPLGAGSMHFNRQSCHFFIRNR